MEKIATRTGVASSRPKRKTTLKKIYGQIAEELRGQYLLTYTRTSSTRKALPQDCAEGQQGRPDRCDA